MINKNIDNENKYFDIQLKKDKFIDLSINSNKKINKIIIKLHYLFILLKNEWFIVDLKENMKQLITIKLDENYIIYKVFTWENYLYLVSNISIIKYDKINDFKKLDEFKWKYKNEICKLKQYKNYLILRCKKLLLIIDLNSFEELLNFKDDISNYINYFDIKNHSYYNILLFKNYLIYFKTKNIINIINWDNEFKIEKKLNLSVMFNNKYIVTYFYKNYLIFLSKNYINFNIIDLDNNYKNTTINNYIGDNRYLKFKKKKKLLFIFNDKLIIVYNIINFEIVNKIWIDYNFTNVVIIRNLLISYNKKINDFILLDEKNIFSLNIINKNQHELFFKIYNNNLIYIDDNKLKKIEIKTYLNMMISKKNYDFKYKNYDIFYHNNYLNIYDFDKNNKKVYSGYCKNYWVYNNYIAWYENNNLTILNLDNLDDIKKKIYDFGIDKMYNYLDTLYILLNYHAKILMEIKMNDLNSNKLIKTESNLLSINILKNEFFIFYKNYIELYDLKINMKLIKKLDILFDEIIDFKFEKEHIFVFNKKSIVLYDLKNKKLEKKIDILSDEILNFKFEKEYLFVFNKNLIILYDLKNNFEIININKEDLKKHYCIFNGLIIFYDKLTFNVYKFFKNNYKLKKYNYIDVTSLKSINNYLFIEQNEKIIKIVVYENNKFNILKELKEEIKNIYIFENLLCICDNKTLKIYNIMNNFEEIKKIIFNEKINSIMYNKDYLLVYYSDIYYKLLLNIDNNNDIFWDNISYNYFLKFNNLKNELNFSLKQLYKFYEGYNILDKSIWFNYILKINYNIIKFTENPKFLEESLNIFGIDKFYVELNNKFNLVDLIISSNKINIFLETIIHYFINNNHFYKINYSQFLDILEKIKDIQLFKILIKYIFQISYIPIEYRKIKYISIDEYKIITSDKLYFDNEKIFNNISKNDEVKKEFEVYNIPFKISEDISDNFRLFEILEKSPDFIKESNLKHFINYFFNKTKYFKYFNIFVYLLLISSMTINLVNKNLGLLICYLICLIYFIFYEIIQFYYDYKTYFKQFINWFDILLIIYNTLIFVYIYLGLFKSINLIIMPLYYLNGYKLINFLKSIDLIRKEIRLFLNVIKNTTSFIFFIVIILVYFTNLNFLFNFNNFNKFNLSFFNVYGQMLGNFDDNFNEYKFYDFFELLVNTYSFNIILLNLFISVISKVFDNYNENLELYDIQEKINLLKEFSSVYFIIDYINKIIFKSSKKEKYYFFIFEKHQQEINLIEINNKLINSEINIKSEIKQVEIKIEGVKSGIEIKVEEVKLEMKKVEKKVDEIKTEIENKVEEVKTDITEIKSDIKKILENIKK